MKEAYHSFIQDDVLERFLRYVQVDTASKHGEYAATDGPSTAGQWDLLRLLEEELRGIGISELSLPPTGYLYATLPASKEGIEPIALLAHVDTSPDQPGENVRPCLRHYNGEIVTFEDDANLTLSEEDSPELAQFRGERIITASGRTLLGADDKAGVAAIMTAIATLMKHTHILHGEVKICFTRDEEIGRGVSGIDGGWLPRFCYTIDGGGPGQLEAECFDAWRAAVTFRGCGVHPGHAYGKLANAAAAAAYFASMIPREQAPETTKGRQGFFHLTRLRGDVEEAEAEIILRDFDEEANKQRLKVLNEIRVKTKELFPGVEVVLECRHSYRNMAKTLAEYPAALDRAREAIRASGLAVVEQPIRGGTDGSLLTVMGHPTPNLFAGGFLFHSRKEWIAQKSLTLASLTVLNLIQAWALTRG